MPAEDCLTAQQYVIFPHTTVFDVSLDEEWTSVDEECISLDGDFEIRFEKSKHHPICLNEQQISNGVLWVSNYPFCWFSIAAPPKFRGTGTRFIRRSLKERKTIRQHNSESSLSARECAQNTK